MSVIRCAAVALVLASLLPGSLPAQTMRFNTSVGSFDMQLNPTNDPNLRPLVDNLVAYIGLGRYGYTSINRAAEGFVLQMGSFSGFPPTPNDFLGLLREIDRLNPVVVDTDNDGQVDFGAISNTRGTVSLALSSAGPNSGTSSFFINAGDNSSLDSQGFVPFARIVDMAVVDNILSLQKTNLTGDPNDLTFSDVPLRDDGRMVVLESVRVLQAAPEFSFVGPVAAALAQIKEKNNTAAAVVAASASLGAVPEPSSIALLAVAALGAARWRRRGYATKKPRPSGRG